VLSSVALVFELDRNPHPVRKEYALKVLAKATTIIPIDRQLEGLARRFQAQAIKPVDALHLASAMAGKADYFCTCDDRFLNRAKAVNTGQIHVVSPLELITEMTQ
jgi:predicted nucleic acid-binding protein